MSTAKWCQAQQTLGRATLQGSASWRIKWHDSRAAGYLFFYIDSYNHVPVTLPSSTKLTNTVTKLQTLLQTPVTDTDILPDTNGGRR